MNAAVDTETHAACWVPLKLRAHQVCAGDVLVSKQGPPLYVVHSARLSSPPVTGPGVGQNWELVVQTPTACKSWRVASHYALQILVPHAERAALLELRRQLGASITDRNTTGSAT